MKTFFGKSNSLFSKISSNICKNSFLNSPIFFPHETPFPKSMYKVFKKKGAEAYSELSQTTKIDLFAKIINDF